MFSSYWKIFLWHFWNCRFRVWLKVRKSYHGKKGNSESSHTSNLSSVSHLTSFAFVIYRKLAWVGFESIPFGRTTRLSYQDISSTRTQSQLCMTFKLKTYKRFFVHWEDAVYFVSFRLFWEKQPPEISVKKGVLKNFTKVTGKHLCWNLFFNKVAGLNFIKKETPMQVFSCKNYWSQKVNYNFEKLK